MNTSLVTMAWVCGMAAVPAAVAAEAATTTEKLGGATESLYVVRDVESGKLRAPTPSEFKALEASAAKPGKPKPVVVQVAPNGMKSVRLPAEYLISAEATRDGSGRLVTRHAQTSMEHGASAALPTE